MFSCANCGYQSVKWLGKCPLCGSWESFCEEKETRSKEGRIAREKHPPKLLKDIGKEEFKRVATGIDEFDRILGGGVVRGEMILIGGEPGVGKSTLLLEVASCLSRKEKTLYVSAEESPQQISLRSKRLKSDFDNLYILGEDDLKEVYNHIKEEGFKFVVIDSIQVVQCPVAEGSKGSIGQIRGCADYLTQIAKSLGVVIFIVGHVTKEGALAGPKLLEHIVDCVLYFEGEIVTSYRILKATKNRFGATGDIAVFEMTSEGLREIKKINDVFLPHKNEPVSGSSVVCVIEGLRPILIELQSLVSRASFGVVRRRSLGFDFNRFSLLVAIIEKRLRMSLSSEDVFLNVAGGLRINDTAADLGAVVAIISSFKEKDIPPGLIFIGEVGLSGELRRINNINLRLKEVERAGFNRCIIPEGNLKEVDKDVKIKVEGHSVLKDIIEDIF